MIIFFQKETIPLSYRDWILIADFENQTGEQVLDKSLYAAFTLSIDQSRYVNVVTRRRMLENLKRMEKVDLNYLDEETIRDMAIREGINIYLIPGISKIGNKYIITCKINEAESGEMLKSEIQYAEGENEILEKLDVLSRNIRVDLGETNHEISQQNKPLRQVTTSSLEALKQYSLGIEEHWKSNFEQARYYYENALKIDSNFISAKASLGNLLFEKFDREKGKILIADAIKSLDRVTDKEKYSILAFYSLNVEGDLEKGIKYTKMRIDLYPDDPTPHNNLGWIYQKTGKYFEAVAEYKLALEIDPHLVLTYGGIVWIYLENLGETDSAFIWTKKLLSRDDENPWSYFWLGSVYVAKDSLIQAARAFKKSVELNPDFIFAMYRLAHVYRLQGEYQKALETLKRILGIDKEEFSAHYDLGINYKNIGDEKMSKEHFNHFKKIIEQRIKKNPNDAELYLSLGIVLARLGDYKRSWELGERALKIDSTSYFHLAEFMAVNGKKSLALNYLEKAIEIGQKSCAWLRLDPDLQNLHDEQRFKEILTLE
jgi:tetratricopeptide (TPR) repeat protein